MDQLSEKWRETQDILDKAAASLETMMNVAECLQRAGEECVRRNELIATALIGPASRECQERDIRSEKWRKFLFERNYPIEFVNEPRWYQILKSYRPSRSMYDGLGMHTRQKITMVDAAVQTDFTSDTTCFGVGKLAPVKNEKKSATRAWKMCCCGRQ